MNFVHTHLSRARFFQSFRALSYQIFDCQLVQCLNSSSIQLSYCAHQEIVNVVSQVPAAKEVWEYAQGNFAIKDSKNSVSHILTHQFRKSNHGN